MLQQNSSKRLMEIRYFNLCFTMALKSPESVKYDTVEMTVKAWGGVGDAGSGL